MSLTASETKPPIAASVPALLEREDCTRVAWYPSLYAPRTGGADDSHHRTAGIADRARRRGGVAARGTRAAAEADAAHRHNNVIDCGRCGRTGTHYGPARGAGETWVDGP